MPNRRKNLARIMSITALVSLSLFSACAKQETAPPAKTSGALSAVQTVDLFITGMNRPEAARNAALLGIFVSEYLTIIPIAMAAESALHGIDAQLQIMHMQQTIQDPDYDLLQAFGDALQVDVAELLNRSSDRQQVLKTYTEALTNVATRSNDRYKELKSQLEELKKLATSQNRDRSTADRDLKKAIQDKDFNAAGEQQKNLTDLQAIYAETDLKRKQTQSLEATLDDLLTIYGTKILAIQQNREALIAGIKVIDVPGADELQVLDKKRSTRTGNSRSGFDSLFMPPMMDQ